jgi:hypothetical protein
MQLLRKQQQRHSFRARPHGLEKKDEEGPTKHKRTCIDGVPFFFFFLWAGWGSADSRRRGGQTFSLLDKKKGRVLYFSFSVS